MKILITGASGGIGKNITEYLVKKNEVVAFIRNKNKSSSFKLDINNINLKVISVDVSSVEEVKNSISKLEGIDALVNCAGVPGPVGKLLDNDLNEWKNTIDVNLVGNVYCCYFALPLLLKSRRGKIINFAGGGSAYPRPFHTAYGVSKTAMVRFTETLALEYPKVDVNVIAPGVYKTNMWIKQKNAKEPEVWGDIQRLKKLINFLISAKSDNITGKFIHYKDNWENLNTNKMSNDFYTLRRLEN